MKLFLILQIEFMQNWLFIHAQFILSVINHASCIATVCLFAVFIPFPVIDLHVFHDSFWLMNRNQTNLIFSSAPSSPLYSVRYDSYNRTDTYHQVEIHFIVLHTYYYGYIKDIYLRSYWIKDIAIFLIWPVVYIPAPYCYMQWFRLVFLTKSGPWVTVSPITMTQLWRGPISIFHRWVGEIPLQLLWQN